MRHLISENQAVILCLATSVFFSSNLQAALVVGGSNSLPVNAIQRVIIPVGSPLHDGSANPIDLGDVAALGAWSFDREAQVGTTIEFVNGNFFGRGTLAGIGDFSLVGGPAHGFDPIVATLSNVEQDPNDPGFATGDPSSISAGDLLITVPNYGIRFDGGPNLELRDPFQFVADFDGLPPSVGTVYTSLPFDQELFAYLEGTNTVAAISTNRILVAVPEPSAGLSLLTLGMILSMRRGNRRKLSEK